MKKRLLALIMVLSLALSLVPVGAVELDTNEGNDNTQTQIVEKGGTVYYGKDGQPVKGATGLGEEAVVAMTKEVDPGANENEFEVTLNVKTNQEVTELSSENPDAAVVLVLDTSGSMGYCAQCGEDWEDHHKSHSFRSRLSLAKSAAETFLDEFSKLTAGDGEPAKRLVKIIQFSDNADTVGWQSGWIDVSNANGLTQAKGQVEWLRADGATNIEAGLQLARNNLMQRTNPSSAIYGVDYLYTILLTDGKPTYGTNNSQDTWSTGHIGNAGGSGGSTNEGDVDNAKTFSDDIRGISQASKLYSICFGKENGTDIWNTELLGRSNWGDNYSTVGKWLTYLSDSAYNGGAAGDDLFDNFQSILTQIALATKAFQVKDTMGANITYEGEIPISSDGGTLHNVVDKTAQGFTWHILNSDYDDSSTYNEETGEGVLSYTFKYKVTLNNFDKNAVEALKQGVPVNTNATLTYAFQEDGKWVGASDENPFEGTFLVPKVKSLYDDLTFTKQGSDGQPLSGAGFELACDGWSETATSGADGTVTFSNVPSGHNYTLKETSAPADYILSAEKVAVPVKWGEVDYTNFTKDANDNNKAVFVNQANTGSLTISKTVKAAEGQTAPADAEFTFTVNFNGEDTLSGNFTYTQNEEEKIVQDGGTIILKANESVTITGIPVGTDYTVTETDPGNGFTSTATGETGTITAEGATAEFTNTYSATPATLNGATDLKVSKNISGRDWQEGDSFTFTLTGQNGAPMPSDVTGNTATVTIDADDAPNYTANFGDITYEVPGTYTYTVQETGEGSNGLTYDSTVYTVAVTVQDVDGALNVTNVGYTASDDDNFKYEDAGAMTFTNTYTTSTVTLTEGAITVEKILTGRDWKDADSFSFTLTAGENTANVTTPMPNPSTVNITTTASTKTEDGYAAGFGAITYDKAGTYSYTITENAVTADGITKDTATYSVEVTVSDDNAGTLTAEAVIKNGDNQAVDTATFTNTFTPATLGGEGADDAITITKNLTGRAWQEGDVFEFTIEGDENTQNAIEAGTVELPGTLTISHSSTNVEEGLVASFFQNIADFFTGNDTVSYEKTGNFGTITFNEAGTYTFLIKETAGSNEDISYDDSTYKVSVTVTKDKETNALTADISSIEKANSESETGWDPASSIVFTNAATASENTKSVQTIGDDNQVIDADGSIAGVGDILTYTIHWVNNAADENGEVTAADITITDTIPTGTEYVADSASDNGAYADGKITWTIDAAAGAQGDVTFKVKVTEDAVENENNEITNTATVGVNDVSYKVTSNPTYVPEKEDSVGEDGSIGVGQELTYTISYKNTENEAATITITDVVPEGTQLTEVPAVDGAKVTMYSDAEGNTTTDTLANAKLVKWEISNVASGAEGTVTMTVKVVSAWEEEVENSASISIGGNNVNITVDTNTETTPIDEADRTITITPADITVYTGGDGYNGVIGSGSSEVGRESDGLPEPGYYITLPDWLSTELQINDNPTQSGATDLSSLLHFTYNVGTESRDWGISLYYDNKATGTSYEENITIAGVPRDRYIYKLLPDAVAGAVRVQFQELDENGQPTGDPILEDDFTLSLGNLYQQYSMTIYPGLLTQTGVKAQIKEPEFEAATFDVKVDTGTLTVRGTTNGEEFTSVVTDEDQVNPAQNFAVVATDPETQYHVNDSMVSVNPEDVSLLADELVIGDDAAEAQNILKKHIVDNDIAGEDANYVYQYLDLVDTTNGNAWVTATEAVDVYWKLPASADANDNFRIVHFNGLNRNYDEPTESIIGAEDYQATVYSVANENLSIKTVNGEDYLVFSTDSFSPFVLVYDSNDQANPTVEKTLSLVNGSAYNSGSVSVGDELTYTITVTNTGNLPLSDVTVTDTFSGVGDLTYAPSTEYSVNGDTITIPNLGVGKTVTISATYIVQRGDAGKDLTNAAAVKLPGDETPTDEDEIETPVDPITPIRPPVDPDKPELNTEDHYAYIVGYPDGNVKPEGNITRAEVATIFFRLLTDDSRDEFWSQTNPYSDVSEDDWYNNAVSTLTNAGIIDGYEDGTFKPNGNITRAEFATIAVRFFEATYEGENLFPDIDGHWAQDYINEAANAGIVDGYPDGTFGPQKLITRAEAMTMVNRTIDRHPHEDHLLDDMIVWPDNLETAWYYEQVQEATNSHEYTMHTDDEQNPYEIWTELLPNRDWSELEKAWSDANDGAGSGEVV